MSKEPKEERFIRLAKARVNKIIKMVRLLGNLSGVSNYSYTQHQVEQIFSVLQTELDKSKRRFTDGNSGKRRFTLSDSIVTERNDEYCPTIVLRLPDDTHLTAKVVDYPDFPAINIYRNDENCDNPECVCFVEYNSERHEGHELCIGVYQNDEEDTIYYGPYMAERD